MGPGGGKISLPKLNLLGNQHQLHRAAHVWTCRPSLRPRKGKLVCHGRYRSCHLWRPVPELEEFEQSSYESFHPGVAWLIWVVWVGPSHNPKEIPLLGESRILHQLPMNTHASLAHVQPSPHLLVKSERGSSINQQGPDMS